MNQLSKKHFSIDGTLNYLPNVPKILGMRFLLSTACKIQVYAPIIVMRYGTAHLEKSTFSVGTADIPGK
ncbi:hypothetical protein PQ469_25770 [Mucilaginibacter sp. KACC 22773]|uniref:hypothetical protein n=1 Tax=Mucilaginibacter sp. KACC 22773 TaxID=3025671 RepID=UPI00236671ED|nr:hypothetical protein [Mucilaginibacter sp. KACC 22773]WDF77296.1 hypothetical protein PQ469_25770 [Mucilaginibacter sp. KACC 22773]